MNEFWEIHRKSLTFWGIFIVAAVISWFAIGGKLYASMTGERKNAAGKYDELKSYEVGTPIDIARSKFKQNLAESETQLEALKESLAMRFHQYVAIPEAWDNRKMLYFDKMLREARENRVRDASINGVKIPEKLGWPDIVDVPKKDHDTVVPKLLRQLSATDAVIALLIYSRVKEVRSIKYEDPYEEGAGEGNPKFVRLYPISVTFVCNISSLILIKNLIHYVETGQQPRKVGQFLEADYFSVRWNGDNPTNELIVTCRLNALEFFEPVEQAPVETTTVGPSAPMGY